MSKIMDTINEVEDYYIKKTAKEVEDYYFKLHQLKMKLIFNIDEDNVKLLDESDINFLIDIIDGNEYRCDLWLHDHKEGYENEKRL